MYQSFEEVAQGDKGPARLKALRAEMARRGLDAFIVPRSDAYQGEYVADCDARLAWLTGFTGSAGTCVVLAGAAAVFADGRYAVQLRAQIDASAFEPVDFPATTPGEWLADRLNPGARIGFDPWLHSLDMVEGWARKLAPLRIEIEPCDNLVDVIWSDRPKPPFSRAVAHPTDYAGRAASEKTEAIAEDLKRAGHRAAVLTLPDSICWLLNIRGGDIPRVPVVQAFALIDDNAGVTVFADPKKFADLPAQQFAVAPQAAFEAALGALPGPVRVDRSTAPYAVTLALRAAGVDIAFAEDPCRLPKACKTAVELDGARAAHLTDAVAMVRFLHWLDSRARKGGLTEIEIVTQLETFRRADNTLKDISFDTIAGAGPNAALPHYRVTHASNRVLQPGELMLVDSGGQYLSGTTDITRTVATGPVETQAARAYTRVLQGMIAISRARFPRGLAGRDLDALARYPLWLDGQDYDHGTGHGVGSYLSVHEGPQGLSRRYEAPLRPGMILSNEPGYYREGHFGIRIENLVAVRAAPETGDGRDQLEFETLTLVPIDTRPLQRQLMCQAEIDWLNAYHALVLARVGPRIDGPAKDWLARATAPI